MKKSEKLTYSEWLGLADEYYLAARSLQWFSAANYPATFAGHHALGLYLKAICFNYSGSFNSRLHKLDDLYKEAVQHHPRIKHVSVELAIDKYLNYEQISRYTSKNYKTPPPPNNGMGTDSLNALDNAVAILRDLSVETQNGLDRIMKGETSLTRSGFDDPHLYLNSVILFHYNNSFVSINDDYLNKIKFDAPTYKLM